MRLDHGIYRIKDEIENFLIFSSKSQIITVLGDYWYFFGHKFSTLNSIVQDTISSCLNSLRSHQNWLGDVEFPALMGVVEGVETFEADFAANPRSNEVGLAQ